MADDTASSYVDMEKLTAPDFVPHVYANALVLSTNNSSDPSIDLTTPLSRALFDLQEIDSNVHTLTSRSALDILTYTSTQNAAAGRILSQVENERSRLSASYARLETEILGQYSKAVNAKLNAERSQQVLNLGRNVQRVITVARQFEALLIDSGLANSQASTQAKGSSKEDHRLILRASNTILQFRDLMSGKEAADLTRVNLVRTIRGRVFEDGEAKILDYARKIIREFAISSLTSATGPTFSEVGDSRLRFISASHILYLLSPAPKVEGERLSPKDFEAEYMIKALQGYLQTAIQSSSAGIGRALGQLPTLDKALIETSARCQNVIALEALLQTISPPEHPYLQNESEKTSQAHENDDIGDESEDESSEQVKTSTLLDLLLESLDTASLGSYFWRSLASSLSQRVQEILNRGGISARTLRVNKDTVRNDIRDCVLRGSRMPNSVVGIGTGKGGQEQVVGNWEREAAVMVGSVMTPLNR